MRERVKVLLIVLISLVFTSCSLLKLNIEGNAEPLPEKTLNARNDIRTYGNSFFSRLAMLDKKLEFNMSPEEEEEFLFWKVSAANSIYSTTYQVIPRAALVDTWYTLMVMNKEIKTEEAKATFGRIQPNLEVFLDEALVEIDKINKKYLDEKLEDGILYDKTKEFLEEKSEDVSIGVINFTGIPIFNLWKNKLELEDENLKSNGTMSDSISNLTSSMNTYSTQTPEVLKWQTQALAYKYNLDGSEIKSTLKSVEGLSIETQNFLRENPDFLNKAIEDLDMLVGKNLESIDFILKENLKILGKEREQLEKYLTEERERTINQVNLAVEEQVDNIFDQLVRAVKSMIIVFILFVLVIFFAPLGLGIYIGKKLGKK